MRDIRGNRIAMIFQEPMTSLNPVHTIGEQIAEAVRIHQGLGRAAALARAVEMLRLVRIPDPERRIDDYPHQFSGGMRQRAMIAMALACSPTLLIADEPTTALDVTIQAQILRLMLELKERIGAAILLITHDLGVVAETCQRVIVMYAGRKVEEAPVLELFDRPAHPYTRGLLTSIPHGASRRRKRLPEIPGVVPSLRDPIVGCAFAPRCALAVDACHTSCAADPCDRAGASGGVLSRRGGIGVSGVPVLAVHDLAKRFPVRQGWLRRSVAEVRAVDGVSFEVHAGETLCVVGESGCGKSTLAKLILRLIEPSGGRIVIEGKDVTALGPEAMRAYRRRVQMVFQDPYSSLNPRLSAEEIVTEPIANFERLDAAARQDRAVELLAACRACDRICGRVVRSNSPAGSGSGWGSRGR